MNVQHFYQTNEAIVDRIDSIIRELEILKSIVTQEQEEKRSKNLVNQLYGALGHGTWDEYEQDIEWKRFDS